MQWIVRSWRKLTSCRLEHPFATSSEEPCPLLAERKAGWQLPGPEYFDFIDRLSSATVLQLCGGLLQTHFLFTGAVLNL
jgi:hypothetical protein